MKKALDTGKRKMRPALSPEAEENQMISLANELAKKKLLDGTASSQIICHFLELGSSKTKHDQELKAEQIHLTKAKTKMYENTEHMEELYSNAINAMRSYQGGINAKDVQRIDDDSDI